MYEQPRNPNSPETAQPITIGGIALATSLEGLDTPNGFLDNLRSAYRQKVITTRGLPQEAQYQFIRDFASYRAEHPSSVEYEPEDPALRLFVMGACRLAALLKRPLSLEPLHEVSELYLHDAGHFASVGLRKPDAIALYHGQDILERVDAARADMPSLAKPHQRSEIFAKRLDDPVGWLEEMRGRTETFARTAAELCAEYAFAPGLTPVRINEMVVQYADPTAVLRRRLQGRAFFLETYPTMKPESVDSMVVSSAWTEKKVTQRLAAAREQPPIFTTPDDAAREQGRTLLSQIFEQNKVIGFRQEDTFPWESYELMRQLYANRERLLGTDTLAYQELDDCIRLTRNYNRWAAKTANASIPEDIQTQVGIFVAYAENLMQLRSMGISSEQAVAAARFTLADNYEQLVEAVSTASGADVKGARRSIEKQSGTKLVSLEHASKLQQEIAQRFPGLPESVATGLLALHTANPERLFAVATQYTRMFDMLYMGVKQRLPHAAPADVRWFFAHTERPLEALVLWADGVYGATEAAGSKGKLPYAVARKIMRNLDPEVTPAQAVREAYLTRLNNLKVECRTRKIAVDPTQLYEWAEDSVGYTSAITDYVERQKELGHAFKQLTTESVSSEAVSRLAFRTDAAELASVASKYVAMRTKLKRGIQDDPHIWPWMTDICALQFEDAEQARERLTWYAHLHRSGLVGADAAPEISSILSAIPAPEIEVMHILLGEAAAYEREELEELLGTTSLEKYAHENILPLLRSMHVTA